MSLPRMIGPYQITERLATGGAGEVYAGIDTKVGREVAIKFLRPELAGDSSYVDRFLAEAKSLGRLNHPNIATLYALPHEDDHVCMIMELVRGRTVEQIIQERRRPLAVRESLAILAQVTDGLAYAHEQGVIHRDIKPSNLMVTESGRVKIMDFGIARVRGSDRMTRMGSAVGTPLYMSPEQCRGLEGDERSDIYSLAVVLYELLAGSPPFKGDTDYELTRAHIGTLPPPLIPRISGIDPSLESAIMIALSKRPEQRFPTMRAFSDAIGATALRGDATAIIHNHTSLIQGATATQETAKPPALHTVALALARSRAATVVRRFKGLHPAVQGVLAGAFAVAIVAGAFLLRAGPEPSPSYGTSGPSQTATDFKSRAAGGPLDQSSRMAPTNMTQEKLPVSEGCNTSFPDCGRTAGKTQVQPQPIEQQPPLRMEASNAPETDKPKFADFETAEKQGNYPEAYTIAKGMDKSGDPAGAYGLGLLYFRGNGVPSDQQQAFYYFSKAAHEGYGMAQSKLGVMYHQGFGGVRKDYESARYWFEKAAASGVAEAMSALSGMCHRREGKLKPDCEQDWSDRAAKAGYIPEP